MSPLEWTASVKKDDHEVYRVQALTLAALFNSVKQFVAMNPEREYVVTLGNTLSGSQASVKVSCSVVDGMMHFVETWT